MVAGAGASQTSGQISNSSASSVANFQSSNSNQTNLSSAKKMPSKFQIKPVVSTPVQNKVKSKDTLELRFEPDEKLSYRQKVKQKLHTTASSRSKS